MKILELRLRRARLRFISWSVLCVLFCPLSAGTWGAVRNPGISGSPRGASSLCGVFAWSLLCTA